MKTLCMIPCGAKKVWDIQFDAGPTEARRAYVGAFHKACQRHAEAFFPQWVILSAKHGLLLPDDVIPSNYDVAFNHKSTEMITIAELKQQLRDKGLEPFKNIVMLGGKKHVRVLQQLYDDTYTITYPLSDCKGIGYMLQKLNNELLSAKSTSGQSRPNAL
jgi:hypothetical protein